MAITREEQYLAKIAGEETDFPNKPILRSEQYLAKIAGEDVEIPEKPLLNEEIYLAILTGESYDIPAPYNRIEQYMAKACGLEIEIPAPITRVEHLWAKIAEGRSWTVTEITGTLPLTFLSKGDDLTNYRIHGTSEGAGVATESGEPAGYKIPISNTSGEQQSNYDLFIGSTKLGAEEYVDYGEQKVYKRTDNLINPANAVSGYTVTKGPVLTPTEGYSVVYIPCSPSTRYTGYNLATTTSSNNRLIGFCDINKNLIGNQPYSVTAVSKPINTTSDTYYIAATVKTSLIGVSAMIIEGNDAPESYIPYYDPVDPPLPFPTISTYKGENTLSSTETLGEVTIKGKIKEAVPNG